MEVAVFGAGCFWCVEAIFQSLQGVSEVLPGYMGGSVQNPTYEQVCTGTTDHVEVCRISFDPGQISYDKLLEVFWQVHDPTTLNRQGGDVGTQYRSVIFYTNTNQQNMAVQLKKTLNENKVWDTPVVTSIEAAGEFWPAESYHANYVERNPQNQYCTIVVKPKLEKFRKKFAPILKK